MFFTILAHIIMALGLAALTALIVKLAIFTLKKMYEMIRSRLAKWVGGKVIVSEMSKVAKKAIEEAEKKGNVKSLAELERMAKTDSIIMASTDMNGNIKKEDIKIYEASEGMDQNILNLLKENGSELVISA